MTGHSDSVAAIAPKEIEKWILRYEGFDPAHEGLREALCTLGNGYFATRGAAPEAVADGVHYPGSYVAGLYNRRLTQLPGHAVENESIVNLPNWLPLRLSHWRRAVVRSQRTGDPRVPTGPGPSTGDPEPNGPRPRRGGTSHPSHAASVGQHG